MCHRAQDRWRDWRRALGFGNALCRDSDRIRACLRLALPVLLLAGLAWACWAGVCTYHSAKVAELTSGVHHHRVAGTRVETVAGRAVHAALITLIGLDSVVLLAAGTVWQALARRDLRRWGLAWARIEPSWSGRPSHGAGGA